MSFFFFENLSGSSSVVHPVVYLVFSWLLHVHSWTCAHLKPWTAQDVITLCSSHSCLTDPNSFVLWKTLGSGAQCSVWSPPSWSRSRWSSPGGPLPVVLSRWSSPGGPLPVVHSRWFFLVFFSFFFSFIFFFLLLFSSLPCFLPRFPLSLKFCCKSC